MFNVFKGEKIFVNKLLNIKIYIYQRELIDKKFKGFNCRT